MKMFILIILMQQGVVVYAFHGQEFLTVQGSLLGHPGSESSWCAISIGSPSPGGRFFEIALRHVYVIFLSQLLKVIETPFLT